MNKMEQLINWAILNTRMSTAQATQEVTSIFDGQIDSNSQITQILGITNEMVAQWKSQGVLNEEINKRVKSDE